MAVMAMLAGWAGAFNPGDFYVRTRSVFGKAARKHFNENWRKGEPIKHRRTRWCPVCQSFACKKPGVPATMSRRFA